jgi:hypothetical protein
MSTITFKALINDIHYDPKKGTLKIQLIAANYVSLDKLATLGPQDENVQVTLESAQTRLDDERDHIVLGEESIAKLKAAAEELRTKEPMGEEAGSEVAGEILTEFPIPKEPEEDGEEGDGGGQGEIV